MSSNLSRKNNFLPENVVCDINVEANTETYNQVVHNTSLKNIDMPCHNEDIELQYESAKDQLNNSSMSKKRNIEENTKVNSTKRHYQTNGEGCSSSKIPKLELFYLNGDKNPVSVLNELRLALKYEVVEQTGPSHAPIFKVAVEVDGYTHYGIGTSKKIAKYSAAAEALRTIIQIPKNNTNVFMGKKALIENASDFTEDLGMNDVKKENKKTSQPTTQTKKSPLMILNELFPNATYECTLNANNNTNPYKVVLTVGDQTFNGFGSSKKAAKNSAALVALPKLIPDRDSLTVKDCFISCNPWSKEQILADYIGRLVQDKFRTVMESDIIHAKRKVIAGFVMTFGPRLEDSEVICFATGTKCISGEFLSMNGTTLSDMHAEIIARRCLVYYLMNQLELFVVEGQESKPIFELRADGQGYRLKDNIAFHLYINTAPCGDARIFSPHEPDIIDKHPNRLSRGQLRTKIEGGEGTILIPPQEKQTWDGILQGERLLNMSCSDKLCRWNILGVQGALLANFVEPIYLKSIILGSLYKPSHLHRALFNRIEPTIEGLLPPYRLHKPCTYPLTGKEPRVTGKTSSFAVLWCTGQDQPEICNTVIGATSTGPSFVCKRNIVNKFLGLCGQISSITGIEKSVPVEYSDIKLFCTEYQAANNCVKEAFAKANLGKWILQPAEANSFECL